MHFLSLREKGAPSLIAGAQLQHAPLVQIDDAGEPRVAADLVVDPGLEGRDILALGVAMPYACSNPVTTALTFTTLSGIVEPNYSSSASAVYLQISPTGDADLVHQ